jgi:hypothetical protein
MCAKAPSVKVQWIIIHPVFENALPMLAYCLNRRLALAPGELTQPAPAGPWLLDEVQQRRLSLRNGC